MWNIAVTGGKCDVDNGHLTFGGEGGRCIYCNSWYSDQMSTWFQLLGKTKYQWPLNNMSLKCVGPLTHGVFSINTISTTRSIVESAWQVQEPIPYRYQGITVDHWKINFCKIMFTKNITMFLEYAKHIAGTQ